MALKEAVASNQVYQAVQYQKALYFSLEILEHQSTANPESSALMQTRTLSIIANPVISGCLSVRPAGACPLPDRALTEAIGCIFQIMCIFSGLRYE